MKILLIGEYYSENLGDPLICKIVQKTIVQEYPDATVIPFDMSGRTDMSGYYEIEDYNFSQKLFLRCSEMFKGIFHRGALFRAYLSDQQRYLRTMCCLEEILSKNRIDLAVFAGGSLFMDYFAGIIYCIVRRLACKNIKVIFHACGMSELSEESATLLRKVFTHRNVRSVSLRDSYYKFINTFRISNKISQTYDTGLSCSKYYPASQETVAEYGVGVINLPELFGFQKAMIEYFIDRKMSFKIITNGAMYDYNFALTLLDAIGIGKEEQSKYIYKRPTTIEELVCEITSFKYIISFRMHSQIVAVSFGIPSFGFVWNSKVKDFYDKMRLSKNYAVPEGKFEDKFKSEVLDMDSRWLSQKAQAQGGESQETLIHHINTAIRNKTRK